MGLYDEENASVTSGDVLDVIYWQTKFAALKLDAALKSLQPEGAIRMLISDVLNGCIDLLRKYPNHGDVKKWYENALAVEKKIDPNAPAEDFRSSFAPWRDYSYESGWRFYHLAKMAADAGDWVWAHSHAMDAGRQFPHTVERMADWPSDVQDWVRSAHAEMLRLMEEAAKKRQVFR